MAPVLYRFTSVSVMTFYSPTVLWVLFLYPFRGFQSLHIFLHVTLFEATVFFSIAFFLSTFFKIYTHGCFPLPLSLIHSQLPIFTTQTPIICFSHYLVPFFPSIVCPLFSPLKPFILVFSRTVLPVICVYILNLTSMDFCY